MPSPHCLGFSIDCAVLMKGVGAVIMALILFIGTVYLLLTFVFGRWMAYLVLMVCFSGWMIIHSTLWFTAFFIAQGPTTPRNLGPRGQEPSWVVLSVGVEAGSDRYGTFDSYPGDPWKVPDPTNQDLAASTLSASSASTTFLAIQANEELGRDPLAPNAITTTQFTVDSIRFATAEDGQTPLAVAQAHFTSGGPQVVLSLYHDRGSVPRYSIMFLAGSLLLFAIHLPLLDRAEKKRKEFLVGGTAPAWYGPA